MFACSGPGAPAAIRENIQLGYVNAAILGLLLLLSAAMALRSRQRGWLLVSLAMLAGLALHPAWTVGAKHGDCGSLKVSISLLLTAGGLYLLGLQGFFYLASNRGTIPPSVPADPPRFTP